MSNMFVPTETMPGRLQAFVKVNPVSILADACRGRMLGEPWYTGAVTRPVLQSLLWALTIAAALLGHCGR